MTLPSKELLSEVFSEEVTTDISVDYAEIDGVTQEWEVLWFNFKSYPLDFVAHKCKEWAKQIGYDLASFPAGEDYICRDPYKAEAKLYVSASTEPEAIFKATSYIMELTECKAC